MFIIPVIVMDNAITFEAFTEIIEMTAEEKAVIGKIIFVSPLVKENDFIDLLEKQDAGWIEKMIEVFRFELEKKVMTLEEFSFLSDVFSRSIEWMVEGSSYLSHFDRVRQEEIRDRCERYWDEAAAYKKAIQLIRLEEDIPFISDKMNKWKISGNLLCKKQVIATINTIFMFSPNLSRLSSRDLVILVYCGLNENLVGVSRYFHERVARVKCHDEEIFYEARDEEHDGHLADAIWLLGANMLEGGLSPEDMAMTRSMFFRYLHETSHSLTELVRDNSFNSLIYSQRNTLFNWDNLLKFSLSDLTGAIVARTSVPIKNISRGRFEKVGQICINNDSITLSPFNCSRKPATLLEVNGVKLQACSLKKINLDGDYFDTLISWKDVFAGYTPKPKAKEIHKERPPVGTAVTIRVKTVYLAKPILAFATIEDDFYEGEGAIHVSQVTRVKLETLESILHPGDILLATVSDSTGERLQFSILEEIGAFVGSNYKAGDPVNALLLNANKELLTWVSEPGFLVFTKPRPGSLPEFGSFYLLEIEKVYMNGYVTAREEMPSGVFFDRHEAVAKLVREYSKSCKSVVNTSQDDEEDFIETDEPVLAEAFIVELTRVLQLYTVSKNSIRNLNLLSFLKLIAHVLGDDTLKSYYDCCIRYLTSMQVFINGEGRTINSFSELESDFSRFPALQQRGDIFKLLAVFNTRERRDPRELIPYLESRDKHVAKVAKLVIAGNLVSSSPAVKDVLRQELLSLLMINFDEEEEEEKIEFGTENGTREFKSSAIYPAESQWQADVEKQVGVILKTICGFLNASGGTLYIGVNDFGVPDGINNDLQYLRCNTDKYELLLRKEIVEHFGGDVNGLIVIKFRYFGEAVVCAVSVPEYHLVVMLNGVAWQRQGNSTLVVTGGDLRLLKRRKKMQSELSRMAEAPLFPGDNGYE